MKKYILILFVLFFSINISHSSEIEEFELEGLSIGESVLDHMSKSEINTALENASWYKDNKFVIIFSNKISEMFDDVQITFKPNDQYYRIYSIMLSKSYEKKLDECESHRQEILSEVLLMLKDAERINEENAVHDADPSGNSFTTASYFYPKSGGYLTVKCTNYGEEVLKEHGWEDSLSVSIGSEEFKNFLINDAYN